MKHNKKQTHKIKTNQKGNAFLIVLLGIALFAALAFTISRSMRSDNTTRLSQREAVLAAADVLDYAQQMERAVNKLRRRGVSENDISFVNDYAAGYEHTPNQLNENKIFNISGGGINWIDPTPGVDQNMLPYVDASVRLNEWMFSGRNTLPGLGTANGKELLLALHFVKKEICLKINDRLGIDNPGESPPPEKIAAPPGGLLTTAYTGTFNAAAQGVDNGVPGAGTACLTVEANGSGDYYMFYHVLIER